MNHVDLVDLDNFIDLFDLVDLVNHVDLVDLVDFSDLVDLVDLVSHVDLADLAKFRTSSTLWTSSSSSH